MSPDTPLAAELDVTPGTFHVKGLPVFVCVLHSDEASARACPRGDIELMRDEESGLIWNRAFEPERVEYAEGYENSLSFSEFFQGYIQGFARDVAARHDLAGKRVIEIGCGDGEFLELLCEAGAGEGVGFEPTYPEGRPDTLADGRARIVRDYYGPGKEEIEADLVVCRQVLEHVPDPEEFLRSVRRTLRGRGDAAVVFEVPNARFTLEQMSLWDVIYEHRSYFSAGTLAALFARTGFDVTGASETYARQFVAVDARPTAQSSGQVPASVDDRDKLDMAWRKFIEGWQPKVLGWREDLAALASAGKTVALWGTGARGVTFLNLADPGRSIQHVVDINPRKHGLFAAGTGQCIGPPEVLREARPDVVIVMNPNYVDEIRAALAELGLEPEIRLA